MIQPGKLPEGLLFGNVSVLATGAKIIQPARQRKFFPGITRQSPGSLPASISRLAPVRRIPSFCFGLPPSAFSLAFHPSTL
jgi:hypothetical protein